MRTVNLFKHAIPSLLLLWGLISTSVFAFDQPQIYQLKAKQRVMILGDSTQNEGTAVAGHIRLADQAQREQLPDQDITIAGSGWPQHTAASLPNQINQLVKISPYNKVVPDVVILCHGLNDGSDVAGYVGHLRQAVIQLREMNVTPIISTPTMWGGLTRTKPLAEAARALAAEMKVPLIDRYAAHADHIMKNTKDGVLLPGGDPTRDGVHFNSIGETLSATAILQAFGLKPVWKNYQMRIGITFRNGAGKIILESENPSDPPGTKVTRTVEEWVSYAEKANGSSYCLDNLAPIPAGSRITLTVEPAAGYKFYCWEMENGPNGGHEYTAKISFILDRHRHISAYVRSSNSTDIPPWAIKPGETKKP